MRILEILPRLPVILFSFLAMIIIGASFGYFQRFVGGDLLDMSVTGKEALARLSEMSLSQKQAHTWITLIPDSLYPIAYGSFFAGATLKLAGGLKQWVVLPALVTIIADFCENIVQILSLNWFESLIVAKSVLTPLKFSAFVVTVILFLVFCLVALYRKMKRKADRTDG
jgi:hypothetical protein